MITFNKIGNHGRFGNQMFQYATLFSIAKTRKYDFGVPYSKRNINEYADFCLPDAFPNLSAKDSTYISVQKNAAEKHFPYNAGIFGIADNTDISGYFQSEKYFSDYRNDLLKEFEFNNQIKEKAENIRSITKEPVISVHLRLGDYLYLQGNHPICTKEYYQEALKQIPDDLLILVFSDEPKKAQQYFNDFHRPVIFMENNDKFVDMAVMNLCDYHVIANSSFSWWGSWLSNSKKTIAPAIWFGDSPNVPKNWNDIYCADWIIV